MISIRLPIHIEAITPQNSSGCLVITCGPGWMPWIISAPIISAISGVGRNAERQHRNEGGLRAGVVGGFRRRHALDRALAEARRVGGDLLLQRVGRRTAAAPRRRPAARRGSSRPPCRAAMAGQAAREIVARRHQVARCACRRDVRSCGCSRLRIISAMPNRPMAIGTKLMPSARCRECRRSCAAPPELTSMPTRPSSSADHDHGDRLGAASRAPARPRRAGRARSALTVLGAP